MPRGGAFWGWGDPVTGLFCLSRGGAVSWLGHHHQGLRRRIGGPANTRRRPRCVSYSSKTGCSSNSKVLIVGFIPGKRGAHWDRSNKAVRGARATDRRVDERGKSPLLDVGLLGTRHALLEPGQVSDYGYKPGQEHRMFDL